VNAITVFVDGATPGVIELDRALLGLSLVQTNQDGEKQNNQVILPESHQSNRSTPKANPKMIPGA
jgi:hypothetical protein